jgi:hypothetical protein
MPTTYTFPTREEFEACNLVRKARSQQARLQAVIDYGIGDIRRASKIIEILTSVIENDFRHAALPVIHGNPCELAMTLYEWAPAINSTCWEIERSERVA